MKFSESVLLASLATSGLAAGHHSRHARFHERRAAMAASDDILALHARALEADPGLAKRCGEMINTTSGPGGPPISFPNCFGVCANQCGSGSGSSPAPASSAAPAPAASSPAANEAKAQPVASSAAPAPAATSHAASTGGSGSSTGGSGSSGSSTKKGLAYNDATFIGNEWYNATETAISWAYNWAPTGPGLLNKIQFVPMFHDVNAESAFMGATIPAGAPVLSLNEPDMSGSVGGSSVSPSDAAAAHQKVMKPLAGSHKIGSPAVSSSNTNGQGLSWLKEFATACNGQCPVDFVPIHWYGYGQPADATTQANAFLSYVSQATTQINSMFGGSKPIWVTEFGAVNGASLTDAQLNSDFLAIVIPKLEQNPVVERYSPFMVGPQGSLGSGTPSQAGNTLLKTT